jgi:hypothetical protein
MLAIVTQNAIMLKVDLRSVILLNVMAPFGSAKKDEEECFKRFMPSLGLTQSS